MGAIPPQHPLRVLVVEDDEDAHKVLHMAMSRWGHACEVAPTGPDAIKVAAAFQPDVVLMDITLSGMDGYDAAREIRQLPGLDDAVFAAVTGHGRMADADRSYAQGFAAHLVKPVDMPELQDFLETVAADQSGQKPDAPSWV